MRRNPKILRDLLDEGVSIESIRKIWSEAAVKVEVAQNSRHPPGLPKVRSQYRRMFYCARCRTWWPLKDLLNGDEMFPKRDPDLLRCPFCSGVLRTRSHHSHRWNFPRVEADLDVEVEPFRGQRRLDEFLGIARIITIRSGGVERKYVVR